MKVMLLTSLLAAACTCERLPSAPARGPFADDFNRTTLGESYLVTEPGSAQIVDGALVVHQAYNHPVWLRRPIPRDATIEFDCWAQSPDGDIKIEAWGDGKSFATDRVGAYTSTAYNFIFGGWHNQLSTLARMHEHGDDRQTRREPRVDVGRHYHWIIARQGGHIGWKIDGQPFLSFDDAQPLDGDDHAYFGFADWESELHFDNLRITAKPGDGS